MRSTQVTIYHADSRRMPELAADSVDLIVTSPPYWNLKDYGAAGQIGYGQSLHDYLRDLYRVWQEAYRVLRPGRRLCINIGDQFARATVYGRYKVIPLHAEVIAQAESLGFDYLGAIIWQKKTTLNTSGGAPIMGSYPYPPNGIVEIDYEYILLFKKPGKSPRPDPETKAASRLTKEEWKAFFRGHWTFGGARQVHHEAVFPPELPRRLIRMFSFVGETVLDPFAGSGTTLVEAAALGRHAIGYEIAAPFIELMQQRLRAEQNTLFGPRVVLHRRTNPLPPLPPVPYQPRIQDARPRASAPASPTPGPLYRVRDVTEQGHLVLENGQEVALKGVTLVEREAFLRYARRYLVGKRVFLKDATPGEQGTLVRAYVYLKNRIFVNAHTVKSGMARLSDEEHRLASQFRRWAEEARQHG